MDMDFLPEIGQSLLAHQHLKGCLHQFDTLQMLRTTTSTSTITTNYFNECGRRLLNY